MAQKTAARGRPKGTGVDDADALLAIAEIMAANPGMKPTTAIKALGITNPSVVRRLRDKYQNKYAPRDAQPACHYVADTASRRAGGRTRADCAAGNRMSGSGTGRRTGAGHRRPPGAAEFKARRHTGSLRCRLRGQRRHDQDGHPPAVQGVVVRVPCVPVCVRRSQLRVPASVAQQLGGDSKKSTEFATRGLKPPTSPLH